MKRSLTVFAGALSLLVAGSLAQAETRFAVQDATGTVDKMVVTDTGNIGVGTTTPFYPIHVKAGGNSGATTLFLHNTGNTPKGVYDSPGMVFFRNNISSVNGGLPQSGDRLGFFSFGANVSGSNKYSANVASYADGAWNSTDFPSYITFETTTPPSAFSTEKMRVTSIGNVGIGVTAPSQKLEVNGGIRLKTSATKPVTCDNTIRGTTWFTQGGTDVADVMEVCAKDATGNYSWKTLF